VRPLQNLASHAVALIAALAVAGCTGLAGTQPTAPGAVGTQASALGAVTSPSRLLDLQIEGSLPAPVPLDALRRQRQSLNGARPQRAFHAAAKVGVWATDTNFNYLVGQDPTGRKTVTAVDLSKNACLSPVALKVDHAQNVWVGCELTSFSGTNGAVQEYSGAGALVNKYLPACPSNVKNCQSFSGFGYDSGLDAAGNVFASLDLYAIETCVGSSCNTTLGGGFEWWPKGDPEATPRLISAGPSCSPICGVGYMDVDGSGNLWFSFTGTDPSGNAAAGLGEVTNPTTNAKVSIVEPLGTYGFFGGVYVSGNGQTLNVIDQQSRKISQYHLPLSPSGKPFKVLGPTRLNAFGIGDPVSGAFNQADSKFAAGDTGGWFDIGKVPSNRWSLVASPNFYSGIDGAAYTPSDK